jgi:hypothetical protein
MDTLYKLMCNKKKVDFKNNFVWLQVSVDSDLGSLAGRITMMVNAVFDVITVTVLHYWVESLWLMLRLTV